MITLPNLGLKIWNLLTDAYDHAQLADNFRRLDEHDHSGGKGVQIPTGGLADAAVTTPKLAPGVQATPIDSSVTASKIATGAVTYTKIASDAVDLSNLVGGSTGLITGCFSAYRNAATSTSNSGAVMVFDSEEWDVSGWYDPANGRFTPQIAGYYRLSARVASLITQGEVMAVSIRKSGSIFKEIVSVPSQSGTTATSKTGTAIVAANGTTDYFDIWVDVTATPEIGRAHV